MASWKVLVVAAILGNVVSGFTYQADEDDDDNTFGYSTESDLLMMFPALPLPIPPPLLPQFNHIFAPIRMPTPPTPPTMPIFHHIRHHPKFHHHEHQHAHQHGNLFPTAETVLEQEAESNVEFDGEAVRSQSGYGDNDGTTIVNNRNGDVDIGFTGKHAQNMRKRIQKPKLNTGPGNHHSSFNTQSSTSSVTVDGKKVVKAQSSVMADDDGKIQAEKVKTKTGSNVGDDDNEDEDFIEPTPPVNLNLNFPDFTDLSDLSADAVLDTKPGKGEEFTGTAVRVTKDDNTGESGTSMATNENGDVKTGKSGKIAPNLRSKIMPPKKRSGPGNYHQSFSKSTSMTSQTKNGVTVVEGESNTNSNDNGHEDEEHVVVKKKKNDEE